MKLHQDLHVQRLATAAVYIAHTSCSSETLSSCQLAVDVSQVLDKKLVSSPAGRNCPQSFEPPKQQPQSRNVPGLWTSSGFTFESSVGLGKHAHT